MTSRYEAVVVQVLALSDITAEDRTRVGGKAWHLASLVARGLPVPAAVVVPADAFVAQLVATGLLSEAKAAVGDPTRCPLLSERIRAWSPPRAVVDAVKRALGDTRGPFAVRSSAAGEDGSNQSFAGQHRTDLGVARDDVGAAIVRCWASLYGDGAVAYRGRGPDPGSMAVIVQQLVEPEVAGVLFTVNPLTGSWREMTVEATWGLGAPIADGTVAPHWYLVRRPHRAPRPVQRVLNRVSLVPMQEDLPEIPTRRVLKGDRVVDEEVPESLRGRPTLSRVALLQLCRLGLKAEAALGEPQDIEWAIDRAGVVHLLQSRPITRSAVPRERTDVLWTRRFVGERWPEPATPMGWSLIEPILTWFIAYPRTQRTYLGDGPALRLVSSRPYANVTAFRHLAFKLPGAPPPSFMLELLPPDEESALRRRHAVLPDLSVYLSFFRETSEERRWSRFAFDPTSNPRKWDEFAARLTVALPDLSQPPVHVFAAVSRVEALQAWVREYVGIHLCSLLYANIGLQLLESALASWMPERAAALLRVLATCPPGNETVRTNAAMWDLAQRATPGQIEAIEGGVSRDLGDLGEPFLEFMLEFGHRSSASWELFTPRWADQPSQLGSMLRGLVGTPDPRARGKSQESEVDQALREVDAALSPGRRLVFRSLVRLTRRYLLLRENQRFLFDRLLLAQRHTLRSIGRDFQARGFVDHSYDIAFLTWPEAVAAVHSDDAPTLRATVATRKARHEADGRVVPPVFLRGSEPDDAVIGAGRLQGLGISPGRARGPVKIVRSPADLASVPAGAILVAEAIDPGWTSIFGRVGGVVLELGGRLSHGAVVAREYGLPAVVNLAGATRVLRDGQQVTVDGTRGIVWVLPDSPGV